ncbi:MAG: oligopeptide ABC transporter ATP-binding protein OppF, partial [Clostridia bacterium]|nr:oligopeptide ABC transporter ATP-binding protein OppF [Clostridia bacterium]
RALLSAVPVPDPKRSRALHREILQGDVPSPINPPKGCVFSTRCRFATDKPVWYELRPGHFIYANQKEIDQYSEELAKA